MQRINKLDEALLDIAGVSMGVDPRKRELLVSTAKSARESYTPTDIRMAAAVAKTAFDIAEPGSMHHALFSKLLENPAATDGNRKIAAAVFAAVGIVSRHENSGKSARVLAPLRAVAGTAMRLTPEVIKTLGLLGMGAGALGGGAFWAGKRQLTSEDESLRKMEIQRDTYGRLASEVKAELARRKMTNSPKNVGAAVEYLT